MLNSIKYLNSFLLAFTLILFSTQCMENNNPNRSVLSRDTYKNQISEAIKRRIDITTFLDDLITENSQKVSAVQLLNFGYLKEALGEIETEILQKRVQKQSEIKELKKEGYGPYVKDQLFTDGGIFGMITTGLGVCGILVSPLVHIFGKNNLATLSSATISAASLFAGIIPLVELYLNCKWKHSVWIQQRKSAIQDQNEILKNLKSAIKQIEKLQEQAQLNMSIFN